MDDRHPARLPVAAPDVPPPPRFVERRVRSRRDARPRRPTRNGGSWRRALDILAGDRLARGAPRRAARPAGADRRRRAGGRRRRWRRTAGSPSPRRVRPITTPRSRWRRGSIRPLPAVARGARPHGGHRSPWRCVARGRRRPRSRRRSDAAPAAAAELVYACLTIQAAGEVTLGFSFREPLGAGDPRAAAAARARPARGGGVGAGDRHDGEGAGAGRSCGPARPNALASSRRWPTSCGHR